MGVETSSPGKTGDNAYLISVQQKRPAIALTQPLNDTQTQTIPLRRLRLRLGRPVPCVGVAAHVIGDKQLVIVDANRDWPLPVQRVLERISHQIIDRDRKGLWMSEDSGIRKIVELNIDQLAVQQVALLIYCLAH